MPFDIVDILNTGVTGFAFIMLYLGYRLTSSVQSKILDKKLKDFQSVDFFHEWKDLVRNQLNNTRYFMLFAALFFAGGLILLVYQAESKIIIVTSPAEGTPPKIYHQAETVTLGENHRGYVTVKTDHIIDVDYENLANEINVLKKKYEDQNDALRETVTTEITSRSSGAGLSLD